MADRSYETPDLVIDWNSQRCVHVARCRALSPDVFDPTRRPWVVPENGTTEEIVAAIDACPTGALRYRWKDGRPEGTDPTTTIYPVQNGPLVIRGPLTVLAEDGSEFTTEPRLTFCRCGHSANQPFCDNSHRSVSFEAHVPTPSRRDADVDAPDEICPPQDEDFE